MKKSQKKEHCKRILNSYKIGCSLFPHDENFLKELFQSNETYYLRTRPGIDHFTVQKSRSGTRCFFYHLTNEESSDFSYLKLVSGINKKAETLSAMRKAIEPWVHAEKDKVRSKTLLCAICGRYIGESTVFHMDHFPVSFKEIAESYIKEYAPELLPWEPNRYGRRLKYPRPWIAYHAAHAKVRPTCPQCNLSRGRS